MEKIKDFLKGSYFEMKKVTWPSKNQTLNYTFMVISFSIVVAVFLGILDMVFSAGIEKFLF